MGISDDIVPHIRRGQHHSLDHDIEHRGSSPASSSLDEVNEPRKEITSVKIDDNFFTEKEAETPPPKQKKAKNSGRAWKWIFTLLVILVVGFVIFSNFKNIKGLFSKDSPKTTTTTSTDTSTADTPAIQSQDYTTPDVTAPATVTQDTSTATTTVGKSALKIQVLNGNGISGSGVAIKKILVTAGYTVSSTGNAKNFNYENTIVYYKTGKDASATLIKEALVGRTVTLEKSDDIVKTYDIVVVVGKT